MSYEKAPYQDSEKSFQQSEKSFLPPPPPYTTAAYPQPAGLVVPPQHTAPNQAYYYPGAPFAPSTGYAAPPPQAQNQQAYYYPGAPYAPSTSPYPTGGAPPVAAPAPPPPQASYPSSSSSSLRAFPPTINGYYSWKSMTTIYLGPSKSEKTHALKIHDKLFSSKQTLALHAGPAPEHPILVSAFSRGHKDQEFTVTVPGRGPGGADIVVPTSSIKTGKMSRAARFDVDVGGGRRETFEWRSSHGEEISAVATGYSFGWKLVRLSGGGANGGPVGSGHGFSSDGNEVVAVIAHNASCSMSKGMRFSFLGSGLAGAFGEVWEIVAVGSALKLWYRDVEHMASAASG